VSAGFARIQPGPGGKGLEPPARTVRKGPVLDVVSDRDRAPAVPAGAPISWGLWNRVVVRPVEEGAQAIRPHSTLLDKFLYAPSSHLARVDIAHRVDGERVERGPLSRCMARASEAPDDLPARHLVHPEH